MVGDPAEPPRQDEPTGDEERPEDEERIGPLTIARHVKDDGRMLILYTRDAQTRT